MLANPIDFFNMINANIDIFGLIESGEAIEL
jgi:hypothetical protein